MALRPACWRSGVPAAGGVLGAAVKGHPVPSRLDRPSGPILPCARHQPPRHQGGGQNGSSLRDIARGRPRHLQRCREAASQSDPCPLRVMRDRLAGGKSQRASRLGHGRPSQGHLMRSGRPNVVTAAVIPRSSTTCCPPSLARPWCPQQPAARTSLSGRSQRCEVPLALRSLLAPEHDRRGGNRPVRAGAGVGARSFAYFSIS